MYNGGSMREEQDMKIMGIGMTERNVSKWTDYWERKAFERMKGRARENENLH